MPSTPSGGRRCAPALLVASLLCMAPHAGNVAAQPAGVPVAAAAPAVVGGRTYNLTFRQLGALFPLQLRGVQGSSGVPFSIRSDEVVVGAKLRINYAYSPALIETLSHIKVLVNEEVVATVPVPNAQGGTSLTREITIPPRLITEFNRVNLELIGHYTMECEDPAHSSLWANVGNDSVLELTVAPLALANDLASLPRPFFDRRDVRPLVLPFVLPAAANPGVLESAGIVSSWFGSLAQYRGARFPTADAQIPARGHAVVMVAGQGRPAGLDLPPLQGPTVAIVGNPNDPNGKLLLVMGRDAAELKTAATALSVGSTALSGPTASITQFNQLLPRKPYDAPNWLRTDRPVKFGELAEASTLNVSGYSLDLIRINFQVPPDLFAWRDKDIPVHIKYRYSPRPQADKSTLNINVNQQFLRLLPLRAVDHTPPGPVERVFARAAPDGIGQNMPEEARFGIPLFKLPSQSQLQFHYYYDYVKEGACKDVILDNVRGAIEPDSTIDISGFPHFIAMPDLAAFSNSGFPFSRMADLSETAVVLPDTPSAADVTTYLNLVGRIGGVTGYPATGVTVAPAQQVESVGNKDLLVIGSGTAQPLLTRWADAMPVRIDGSTKQFQLSDLSYRLFNWWRGDARDTRLPHRSQITFNSNSTDAIIAGFESPLASRRSVIVFASNQPAGLGQAFDALVDVDTVKNIQGSLAVIRGKQVQSLVAEDTYYVGRLGPFLYMQWFLSRNPLILLLFGVAAAMLVAAVVYLSLRARAKARLQV